jgi:hypothetical protein
VLTFEVIHTDTFAGEANYAWVNRHEFKAADDASRRSLVQRAKKECGLTNHPCDVTEWGDDITIQPRGLNQIVFVNVALNSEGDDQ